MPDTLFNRSQKLSFAQSIRDGKLSHAYIIEGGSGFGKTEFALFAAAAILCSTDSSPCGSCNSCKKVLSGAHPDLYMFGSADGKSIGVDAVRNIKNTVFIYPGESDRKVYIIDDAQRMTVQAQNALLKLFEEPPQSCVFFLVTEKKEDLLPTVISRGQLITLFPAGQKEIVSFLETKHPRLPKTELELAASLSCGSIGYAEKLLEKASIARRRTASSFLTIVFSRPQSELISFLQGMKPNRDELKGFLLLVFEGVNQLLKSKSDVHCAGILSFEDSAFILSRTTARKLSLLAEAILDAYAEADMNANINLLMTKLAVNIGEIKRNGIINGRK